MKITDWAEKELARLRALVADKKPPHGWRTWDDAGERCNHCCNGDRCDDRSHSDRDHCEYCLGTGHALWHEKFQTPNKD